MKKCVYEYVSSCNVCQLNKGEHVKSPGLLQPLNIPEEAWASISMDFVSGLPRSEGKEVIMVVVDRLTKYAHFLALSHPYTASTVAQVFLDNIHKLHGLPTSIVSDRDPVFTSRFWKELIGKLGIKLNMSTAYHPQTDGQTERVNQCLEQYLRCMVFDQQKTWFRWLPLAEYWYNTTYQQSLNMTPFQALYGYTPPLLPLGDVVRSTNPAVNVWLKDRQRALVHIRNNLLKAQNRMKKYADLRRSERSFQIGDWVYLCFQPYRQDSLGTIGNQKLNAKYCGPFEILDCIGKVAYKLNLPVESHIHPVIHVSQLKKHIGRHHTPPFLPWLGADGSLRIGPEKILDRRMIKRGNEGVSQVRIKWSNLSKEDSTWEDYDKMKSHYSSFILEVEKNFMEGVMSQTEHDQRGIRETESTTSLVPTIVQGLTVGPTETDGVSLVNPSLTEIDGST